MINSSLVGNSMGKSATEVTSARTRQYRAQSQPRDARWPVSPRSRPTAQRPHRLVEGAAQVLWILDKEALAAEGLHYPVIAGAVNQCVGLQVEHRAFRDLRHARADAAIVQDDDLGREVVTDQRLHLHARKADRRVAGEVDDRPVGMHDAGGDGVTEADATPGIRCQTDASVTIRPLILALTQRVSQI